MAFKQDPYHCGLPRVPLVLSLTPDWNFSGTTGQNKDDISTTSEIQALTTNLPLTNFQSSRTRARSSPPVSPTSMPKSQIIHRSSHENEHVSSLQDLRGSSHQKNDDNGSVIVSKVRSVRRYGPPSAMPVTKLPLTREEPKNNSHELSLQSSAKLNTLAIVFPTPNGGSIPVTHRYSAQPPRLATIQQPSSLLTAALVHQSYSTWQAHANSVGIGIQHNYSSIPTYYPNGQSCSNQIPYPYNSSRFDNSQHSAYLAPQTGYYQRTNYPSQPNQYNPPTNQLLTYNSNQPYAQPHSSYLASSPNYYVQPSSQYYRPPPTYPTAPNINTPNTQTHFSPNRTAPSSSPSTKQPPPNQPTSTHQPKPHSPSISAASIRTTLARWLRDPIFMSYCRGHGARNPFPGIDLNTGWTRPRCELVLAVQAEVKEFPPFSGGDALKLEVLGQLTGFSLARQAESWHLSEEMGKMGWGMVFVGCEKGDKEWKGWKREPGAWWGRKRFVLGRGMGEDVGNGAHVVFMQHIDSLVSDIEAGVRAWEATQALVQLCLHDSEHEMMASLKRKVNLISTAANTGLGTSCVENSESSEDPSDVKNSQVFGEHYNTNSTHAWKYRKITHISSLQTNTMSEQWRKRRSEQEKRARRWTDGTVRMWRVCEEFYWVCDGDGGGEWSGLFGGRGRGGSGEVWERRIGGRVERDER